MAYAISIFCAINFILFTLCASTDTLKQGQQLRDWEQLISAGGVFRLGFFNPNPEYSAELGPSGPRHLGIWFDKIPYYSVWVANRKTPVPDSSGFLTIDKDGQLKIIHQDGLPIVINPEILEKNISGGNFTVTLLDSGNLVVHQVNSNGVAGSILWQSFDYPHNILLPGMKLGMNLKTGKNWTLTSWLSEKVPAPGAFRLRFDPSGKNQLIIWRRDTIYWSSGVFVNGSFELAPQLTERNDIFDFRFVENEEEKYFSYSVKNKSVLSRWDLDTMGEITVFAFEKSVNEISWIFQSAGSCRSDLKNLSAVCLSEKPNKCRDSYDAFVPKRGYFESNENYFDYNFGYYSDSDLDLSLSDCHAKCWNNCTCIAYQSLSLDGVGCKYWSKGSKFCANDGSNFIYLLKHF